MTIEERAENYMNNYPHMDDSYYDYYVRDGYIQGAKEQQDVLIKKIKEYLSMEPYGVTDMCSEFEEDLIKYLEE